MAVAVDLVTYLTGKVDEPDSAIEDALGIASGTSSGDFRLAVADGASMSSFSGLWANLLVQAFINEPFLDFETLKFQLPGLAQLWRAEVYGSERPWHALLRASRGAFAAIIGCVLSEEDTIRWRAISIGDCSMFVFRDGRLHSSFPFSKSDEFPKHPKLCSSLFAEGAIGIDDVKFSSGVLIGGDTVLLASDAMSRMIFEMIEGGSLEIAAVLDQLSEPDSIAEMVHRNRLNLKLENDDVAVSVLRVR